MKKIILFTLSVCLLALFIACKSSKESAYKSAIDKMNQQSLEQGQTQAGEPIEITPVVSNTTDQTVRNEKVVIATGDASSLKAYSVVCGSFNSKANADGLRDQLVSSGYKAIVVQNPSTSMYRVICASFDTKDAAAQARDAFKAKYPDRKDFQGSWLLYNN